jgi:hypothetical protein
MCETNYSVNVTTDLAGDGAFKLKDFTAGRFDLYSANDRCAIAVPISDTTRERDSEPIAIFNGLVLWILVSVTDTDDAWALARITGPVRCTPNVTVWLAELEVCAQTPAATHPTRTESESKNRINFIDSVSSSA